MVISEILVVIILMALVPTIYVCSYELGRIDEEELERKRSERKRKRKEKEIKRILNEINYK